MCVVCVCVVFRVCIDVFICFVQFDVYVCVSVWYVCVCVCMCAYVCVCVGCGVWCVLCGVFSPIFLGVRTDLYKIIELINM